MRRVAVLVLVLAVAAVACGRNLEPAAPGDGGDGVDQRKIAIYEAVIRAQVEFKEDPVYIYTRLCEKAGDPGGKQDCPDALSPEEQDALLTALSDYSPLAFVSETGDITDRILGGEGGQLIHLGPIAEVDGRIQVPGSHYCGGLCGGGSTWVVEETAEGWEVTGPAPGEGVWMS